jgi:hypothetical protein
MKRLVVLLVNFTQLTFKVSKHFLFNLMKHIIIRLILLKAAGVLKFKSIDKMGFRRLLVLFKHLRNMKYKH